MTGKELLLHPFINRMAVAPYMYPQEADAAALLENKLRGINGASFDSDDDEKAVATIGLLLRAFMQPQTNPAAFDADTFSEN